ncbi:hypothetical protein LI328DRAFT_50510 [Trichoderma asperelloides]|nr:hypothetical protein LI328DRAFT_50510 [Trichoderma asperelloides]
MLISSWWCLCSGSGVTLARAQRCLEARGREREKYVCKDIILAQSSFYLSGRGPSWPLRGFSDIHLRRLLDIEVGKRRTRELGHGTFTCICTRDQGRQAYHRP